MSGRRTSLRALCLVALLGAVQVAAEPCPAPGHAFPPFYTDAAPFQRAIAAAPGPWTHRLSGITVPHHLLVPQLIADGISRASGQEYDRILLLFPDHFGILDAPFGTLAHDVETVLGRVPVDPATGSLGRLATVATDCALAQDHGLRALLPFVAEALAGIPVLPVAVSIRTGRGDWEQMAQALTPLVTPRTLVLQSTDFSHYLPHHEARQRDRETLNVLSVGDLTTLSGLVQPDHLDSAGAMYLQLALQQRVFGARPMVVANMNSQELAPEPVAETTSYMVILFTDADGVLAGPVSGERLLFGGDTFFGRAVARALPDELAATRLEAAVSEATRGLPLVVNLEGVLLPDMPPDLPHLTLGMPAGLATDWLTRMGATAVSLANNHADDLGAAGLQETRRALALAGLEGIPPGGRWLRPGLAVVALSDFKDGQRDALDAAALDALVVADPARAVVAFVHWGREFETRPGPREDALAEAFRARGASVVIGAHPHRASVAAPDRASGTPDTPNTGDGPGLLGGGETLVIHSLGNFFFDQGAEVASGALAELTVFPQGTVFTRLHALPNLFDRARGIDAGATGVAGNRTE